jgi:serine/threonine protein kinase
MGEVYRARDPRLGRDVAVKVLPDELTASPEARQRFEREARSISKLSHAHVCALFDVGREGNVEYLVMELLEGETLASRLTKGPLPIADVLRLGGQIADALAAAHQHDIVHRDLKPGNVMLTRSGVKLLDFGLAKAAPPSAAESADVLTKSETSPLTEHGQWLGTVPYMSPEQLEGRAADARSDVFALGLVLYQMAAGRRAFGGDTSVAAASAILHQEPPPLASARPDAPAALARLVHACLVKDPDARWQSARDAMMELASMGTADQGPSAPAQRPRWIVAAPWALAAVAIVSAFVVWRSAGSRPPAARVELQIVPPVSALYHSVETVSFTLSPDGSTLAFVAPNAAATRQVWIRPLTSIAATPVAGTEDALSVFWSPDGRSIAFFAGGLLKRIELPSGPAVTVCAVRGTLGHFGSWSGSDILFASISGEGIHHVSVTDGQVTTLVKPDAARDETRLSFPAFLPGGRRFLYVARATDGNSSLMIGERGQPSHRVMPIESNAAYVDPGLLVFARDGTLVAQRFDAATGSVSGEPFAVAEAVRFFWTTSAAAFSVSSTALVSQSAVDRSRLALVTRDGRVERTLGTVGPILDVRIVSGGRALFSRAIPTMGTFDIWSVDLGRGTETRLTQDDRVTEISPVLLPDDRTMIYSQSLGRAPRLTRRELGTSAPAVVISPGAGLQNITDISKDGRVIAMHERTAKGDFDIWTVPVADPAAAVVHEPSDKNEVDMRFSPDGRYYSFISSATGPSELYVSPLAGGIKTRVSEEGAVSARWNPAGGELFYITPDQRMMRVPIATSPTLRFRAPTAMFGVGTRGWPDFAVTADGQRFLAIVPESFGVERPLTAILNWRPAGR